MYRRNGRTYLHELTAAAAAAAAAAIPTKCIKLPTYLPDQLTIPTKLTNL